MNYHAAKPLTLEETLNSDKDLLVALNLKEPEVAKILGRSRQSLSQANLGVRTNYFKKPDILSLVFEARGRKPDLDITAVIDYIARTRGAAEAQAIQSRADEGAQDVDWSIYEDLWVVIPDVSWFEKEYPEALKAVVALGAASNGRAAFYTSSIFDKASVESALRALGVNQTHVVSETWMGAIPPLIIGNPRKQNSDTYLFIAGRFVRNEWYGGGRLAMLIHSLLEGGLQPTMVKAEREPEFSI